jgi:D-xylose transport system permease protein
MSETDPDVTPPPAVAPPVDPRLLVREEGIKGYLTEFERKIRGATSARCRWSSGW